MDKNTNTVIDGNKAIELLDYLIDEQTTFHVDEMLFVEDLESLNDQFTQADIDNLKEYVATVPELQNVIHFGEDEALITCYIDFAATAERFFV